MNVARAARADGRPTPWHTDEWFTSPWNHDLGARRQVRFPESVQIHDSTLRDGEQQAGVIFSGDDRIRIADALAEAGVHRIEAGWPAVSRADRDAIAAIAKRGLPSEIYAFSRCQIDDVQRAADCGVGGVVLETPSSRHLIELGYRWSVERAMEASVEAARHAREQGLKVSLLAVDATRARLDDYLAIVSAVARDGHMDALVLVDTFGSLTPQAVARFVSESRTRFNVPLETHFHMDYGLGIANSLIAAATGVSTIHVTVGGLGERAGNAPLEETAVALRTLYDLDIGMQLQKLAPLHRLVMELAGVAQPPNRPVTGVRLFEVESEIASAWVRNARTVDLTEAFPYLPSLVGQREVGMVLGKGSGIDSVLEWLDRLGLDATPEQAAVILEQVKAASLARKRLLEAEEFRQIVHDVVAEAIADPAAALAGAGR